MKVLPLPRLGRWVAWRSLLAAGCAVLCLATGAAMLTCTVSLNTAVSDRQEAAVPRLDSVASVLDSALARFDYLLALLETTPEVTQLLARPTDATLRDQANHALVRVNDIAGADMLFVLDAAGDAVAAADWNQPTVTTLGHNYSYRPYGKGALATGRGRFFGVDATSRVPGYVLSYPLRSGDRSLGVAAVNAHRAQFGRGLACGRRCRRRRGTFLPGPARLARPAHRHARPRADMTVASSAAAPRHQRRARRRR